MAAFDHLLIGSADHLRSFALKFTGDGEDAKDLLNDTMCRALIYRDNYVEGTDIKAWLFVIMRNLFINGCRRRTREKKIFSADLSGSGKYIGVSISNQAEGRIIGKEVQKAVHFLPVIFRTPFTLYVEGYPYQEIADMMEIPVGTVKSRIHLARKLLKGQVSDIAY